MAVDLAIEKCKGSREHGDVAGSARPANSRKFRCTVTVDAIYHFLHCSCSGFNKKRLSDDCFQDQSYIRVIVVLPKAQASRATAKIEKKFEEMQSRLLQSAACQF